MTMPQLIASLDAAYQREVESSLRLADAIHHAGASLVGKDGHRAFRDWVRKKVKELNT